MQKTKNLLLGLFEGRDKFDYKVLNENWEAIDEALTGTLPVTEIKDGVFYLKYEGKESAT